MWVGVEGVAWRVYLVGRVVGVVGVGVGVGGVFRSVGDRPPLPTSLTPLPHSPPPPPPPPPPPISTPGGVGGDGPAPGVGEEVVVVGAGGGAVHLQLGVLPPLAHSPPPPMGA